ncbi:hypothetical protein [Curtobacterium sp. MCSS17_016]|uniref:hypothetical protein n=1 Tax=Curtobacterium sp. MCSS17_016 TaxID=2175644 RepID=UPI000DAA6F6D|nr:hypothetical protein [Curtobacterium sp. MCSS17_016]WIE81089.1 hypothetical protein DEJ19_021670 [Curtobacterium sp. MCSS17_016]
MTDHITRKGEAGQPTTNRAHFAAKQQSEAAVTLTTAPAAPEPLGLPARTLQGSYRHMKDLDRQREEALAAVAAIDFERGKAALEQIQLYAQKNLPNAEAVRVSVSGWDANITGYYTNDGGEVDLGRDAPAAQKMRKMLDVVTEKWGRTRVNVQDDIGRYGLTREGTMGRVFVLEVPQG